MRPTALPRLTARVTLVALCLTALVVPPASAQRTPRARAGSADRPFEAEHAALIADVSRRGRSARAMIPLLEAWRMWNDVPSARSMDALARLARDARLSVPVRQYAAQLHARGLLRTGDADASVRAFDELGYVRTFRVVGPFDNEGKQGFARAYEPEAQRMAPPALEAEFEGRERPVRWRAWPDVSEYGYLSFDAVYRPDTNVCAYAETFVVSERAQPLSLFVGGGGAIAVWWNGDEVLRDARYRQPDPDRHAVIVGAHAGPNRVLVKSCVAATTWGFFLRVGDASGAPARGVTTTLEVDASQVHAGSGVPRLPAAPRAPLAELETAAEGEGASASALEDLARMLVYTGADDPAEERAKQISARAAEREPRAARLALAAELATERGAAMSYLDRAAERWPRGGDVLLARARLASNGPSPEDALAILDRIPARTTAWAEGQALRAELLRGLDLEESARAAIVAAAELAPGTARWTSLRATAADGTGREDEAYRLRVEALALRWDDLGVRRTVLGDALQRGARDEVLQHLDVYRRLGRASSRSLSTIATIHEALGDEAAMIASYREATELAPEDATSIAAYGHALLRAGQRDAGAELLRRALALRPQDAATRELLENLAPVERPDEAFAIAEDALLARVTEGSGYPSRILQNLTVNTVFDSGLGTSFRQLAAQVIDAEGARDWRSYSIQFDPDVQRVAIRTARVYRQGRRLEAIRTYEQQLGEPWYRIYYDTRALVVVFPDLEPGDVVELRWRVDDVAERNLFDDYYGDVHYLQGSVPTSHMEYVLITPARREIFFNEPRLASLQHERRVDGDRHVDRFVARDIPAIEPEAGMPGYTEIAPYLHVSTYRTWDDVGRWWWGLVHDQLYADESLRRTVRELTDGVTDLRERVRRIYDWVIRHTRYVGLEFGIHGFQPYRVPQIVQRGFGDCKDKASLIYTMLREAGIEAHMVLVRTRRNGAIHDLPASLAVFDHAIAYVPALDLYLDGTAEHAGITDFPQMDQGVTVLHVWPTGSELRRTPVQAPDMNRRTRTIAIELADDGSAQLDVTDEVRGADAYGYRSTYQAEGTRADRFERALRGLFPGLELASQEFSDLDDYAIPVRVRYRARVPQMAIVDADGLRLGATVLDDLTRTLARTATRRHALDLGGRSSYAEERRVRVPAGYRVTTSPAGGEATSPYGALRMAVSQEGRDIVARTELTLDRDVIPADEYAAFRQWVERADQILRQRIVLTGGR